MTKDKNIDFLRLEKPQGRAQRSAVQLKRLSNLISDNIRESWMKRPTEDNESFSKYLN